jgi:hypothetical protein
VSHFAKLAVQYLQKNEPQLVAALKKMYGDDGVEVHSEPKDLQTYFNESATNQTNEYFQAEPCNIIVRRKAMQKQMGVGHMAFNDAGYRRNAKGGYDAFIDEAGMPTTTQGLVSQEYALMVAEKELRAKGYAESNFRRIQLEDNSIRLEAVRLMR